MRKAHVCPKCHGNRILLIARVADQDLAQSTPLRVALVTGGPDNPGYTGYGDLTSAVCRSCGYTEFYTINPQDIPVDGKQVVEVIGPERDTPFR